jgi:uncharacterized membrane protein
MQVHTTEDGRSGRAALSPGWLSVGVGLTELVAPRQAAGLLGLPPTSRMVKTLRLLSLREISNGLAILQRPSDPAALWARVAGDGLGITLLSQQLGAPATSRARVLLSLALLGGVAFADLRSAMAMARLDGVRGWEAGKGFDMKAAITINRSVQDVYRFWRQFETFPGFMRNFEEVERLDDCRSRWTFAGPAGVHLDWEAEIVADEPDRLIGWRSTPGSVVDHLGAVRFAHARGGRGTEARVELTYRPPVGEMGRSAAWLFGSDPHGEVRKDLRRVKHLLEIGDMEMA